MKKTAAIILILAGILSVVFGIVSFTKNTGSNPSFETYGGDAYTGIQHAQATTARNVEDTNEILRFGFGSLLLVIGLLAEAGGINGLEKQNKAEEPEAPAPLPEESAVKTKEEKKEESSD